MTRPLLIALLILPLAACVTVSETGPATRGHRPAPREPTAPPAALAVSPLTRIGFDPNGNPTLFLHLDFRDAGNGTTKAFGQLRVELYQPPAPGAATQTQVLAQSWDADLTDPVRNALCFDEMITRTYTINLTGIPEWLLHWSRHEDAAGAAAAPTLIVQFLAPNQQPLRATYTLTR